MLAKDMTQDVAGYNFRTYEVKDGVETANLYKGKTKVGTVKVENDEFILEIKNEKAEMAYSEAKAANAEDPDFVLGLLDYCRQKKFEDDIRPRLKAETIFKLKDPEADVVALQIAFENGGEAEMEERYKDQIEICFNRAI